MVLIKTVILLTEMSKINVFLIHDEDELPWITARLE